MFLLTQKNDIINKDTRTQETIIKQYPITN
jgi:hypothetical protein